MCNDSIDTPPYLAYLAKRFQRQGGRILRAKLASLSDALDHVEERPKFIINCTGLGSLDLADVKDEAMQPVRGQLCLIRAPWIKYGKTFIGKGFTSYSIPRSSGIVVLGGTREHDDW
jgi:glycine/D-amino acid oxidase-like deaminating enzyme